MTAQTKYVRAALGLHPQLVSERAAELALWMEYLPQARYVGEVGLDAGPRFFKSLQLQTQVFEQVLRACAEAGGRILTVHSTRSAKAVLDIIQANLPPERGRVVLHWFTGSKEEARRAVDLGCYFSVNAQMLSNERHRTLVAALPLDRILTESDSPFAQGQRGVGEPADILMPLQVLARLYGRETPSMARAIRDNLRRLVTIDI